MDTEVINPEAIVTDVQKLQALVQSPEGKAILALVDERLALLPQIQALEAKLDKTVPGWRTSEFWMTALGHVALILTVSCGALPAKYAVIAAALSQAAYTLSRGVVKKGSN